PRRNEANPRISEDGGPRTKKIPNPPSSSVLCRPTSARLPGRVPPRADAGLKRMIAFNHVDRLAPAGGGDAHTHVARGGERLGGEPVAVVTPQARPFGHFLGLPSLFDQAAAPAALDHEFARRAGVERCHVVVDV